MEVVDQLFLLHYDSTSQSVISLPFTLIYHFILPLGFMLTPQITAPTQHEPRQESHPKTQLFLEQHGKVRRHSCWELNLPGSLRSWVFYTSLTVPL